MTSIAHQFSTDLRSVELDTSSTNIITHIEVYWSFYSSFLQNANFVSYQFGKPFIYNINFDYSSVFLPPEQRIENDSTLIREVEHLIDPANIPEENLLSILVADENLEFIKPKRRYSVSVSIFSKRRGRPLTSDE